MVAALIVLASVAGCSSSSSSPSTPASSPSTSSPAAPSSNTAPATAPASSLSPAATGPSPCATSGLNVTLGPSSGYAGGVDQTIIFTNTSGATCTLYGYPGVSLVSAPPYTQIGLAAQRSSTTPVKLITLASGATASAVLQIVDALNFGTATCSPTKAAFLRIYPPNQTAPVYLADASEVCAQPVQTLFISAVQAGSGGTS
ncbi:MAG: DUF4232 domain-containing protein [Streptosporangiaceae bacterium]